MTHARSHSRKIDDDASFVDSHDTRSPRPQTTLVEHISELVELEVEQPLHEQLAEPLVEPLHERRVTVVTVEQPQSREWLLEPLAKPHAQPLAKPLAKSLAQPLAKPLAQPLAMPLADPLAQPRAEPTEPRAEPPLPGRRRQRAVAHMRVRVQCCLSSTPVL